MSEPSMTPKEYLSQAYRIDQRINSKLMQMQSYRELATKATGVISDSRRADSPELQKMAGLVAKIVDLENEINDDIDTLIDLKAEIARAIERIDDVDLRLLLELRYLCFQTWEQIAVGMTLDRRWLFRLHGKALGKISRVLGEIRH